MKFSFALIILLNLRFFCAAQDHEIKNLGENDSIRVVSGKLSYNSILNEFYESDSIQQLSYKKYLDSLNIKLVSGYLEALNKGNFKKAKRILSKDNNLSELPERVIAILYSQYYVNSNVLLFLPCLSIDQESSFDNNAVIYMDNTHLEILMKNLDEHQSLKVKRIEVAPLTKFEIYQLVTENE